MALVGAAGVACSDSLSASFDGANRPSAKGDNDGDAGELGSNTDAKGGVSAVPQGAPTSDGVLIVHAATFSSFRLCFSNHMDMAPQPDAKVMPQANVVGVEIGSIVRIDPIEDAGTIYVIREPDIRNFSGDTTKKCSDFIHKNDAGVDTGQLQAGVNYVEAKSKDGKPFGSIGVKQADVLAISGCGSQNMIAKLDQVLADDADISTCPADWKASLGGMGAAVVPLLATIDKPTDTSIPIQLYNMAPAVDALKGTLKVDFGETGKQQELPLAGTFEPGNARNLEVDQTKEESYGQQSFTIKATIPSSPDPIMATQTLADVQHLSSPNENPTTYYRAASNYALLVLGNPAHKPKLSNGDPNPAYNPLRAMHILAVPVLDPTKVDAGADASTEDAGTP